jgi:hypothetical protein
MQTYNLAAFLTLQVACWTADKFVIALRLRQYDSRSWQKDTKNLREDLAPAVGTPTLAKRSAIEPMANRS